MAVRPGLDPLEEKKSHSALFALFVAVLLVVSIWAIWDDNVSRRPWKEYQVEFDELAYNKFMKDAAAEQKKLNANPEYVKLTHDLDEARRQVSSGATTARLDELRAKVNRLKVVADDKAQVARFTKSTMTERWYDYNHAVQEKEDSAPYWNDIQKLSKEFAVEQEESNKANKALQSVKDEIEKVNSKVSDLTEALGKLTKTRDDFIGKADTYMIPVTFGGRVIMRYPKIPKIQQTAIDGFDRNDFDEAIVRVDRCQSCHMGIDKRGFENAPQPFRTHSNYEEIILKHSPDKLGCTPCHAGQGAAVNSVEVAHGYVEFWTDPMLKGAKMQSRCIKCHIDVPSLRNKEGKAIAVNWVRGERMFQQMGCHGCHLVLGYEDMPKIGPYLKRAGAKLDPSWTVRWITNPHLFRPHTRMPNFMFTREQATQISAYLFSSSAKDSAAWLKTHPEPAGLDAALKDPAMVEEGKGLFESVGCKGCHAVASDQYGTPVGSPADFKPGEARTTKDFAPNLSKIAEKTSPQWLYWWLKDPRLNYAPNTSMPSLRLSDHEAEALVAFLMTHGNKQQDAGVEAALNDPANIKKGEALVRKYGCFACHEIHGMEREARIGVELTTFGSKHLDELFFGNNTDVPRNWDDWTYKKLYSPRTYATKDVEQLMPNFEFQDEDIRNLRVFLASLTTGKVPEVYRAPGSERQQQIVDGRRVVNFRNCVGCHVVENRGGYIRHFYPADQLNLAPPILNGEGQKVQPEWLFTFLENPVPIRPWLKVRMPTFHFGGNEADTLVNYFTALANLHVPFMFVNTNVIPGDELAAGQKLMSNEYFNCFSCHQQGDKKPEGPAEGWAPDLSLAHRRLNPDWILRWLKNPQAVQPGAKMPSFFPGGPEDVLGGNEAAQIRALRDYIFWFGSHPGQQLPSQAVKPVAGPESQPKKMNISER